METKPINGKGPETGNGNQSAKPNGMTKGVMPLEGNDSSLKGLSTQKSIPELFADLKVGNEKKVRHDASYKVFHSAWTDPKNPVLRQFVPQLIELVKDDDFVISSDAIHALGHIGDERAIPVLAEAMRKGGIAGCAIDALVQLNAMTIFSEALKDENWIIRYSGVMGLAMMKNPEALVPLAKASNDSHGHVKMAALMGFTDTVLGTTVTVPLLTEALSVMDPEFVKSGKEFLKWKGFAIE